MDMKVLEIKIERMARIKMVDSMRRVGVNREPTAGLEGGLCEGAS
jgi:hypothetical protein